MTFWVYIMANRRRGTLYTGHTDNLVQRTEQHKQGKLGGFTAQYDCKTLVWFSDFHTRQEAKEQEARIKRWRRAWKIKLIGETNPEWTDVSTDIPYE